jgi:hypothetical protein
LSYEHEVGVKWKVKRSSRASHWRTRGCLWAVIVEDHVNDLAIGNLGLDGVEEADELLMPMALHVAANHRAIEDIQSGEDPVSPKSSQSFELALLVGTRDTIRASGRSFASKAEDMAAPTTIASEKKP